MALSPEERRDVAKAFSDLLFRRGGISEIDANALKKYAGPEIEGLLESIAALTGTKRPLTPESSPLIAWVAGKGSDDEIGALFYEFNERLTEVMQLFNTTKGRADKNIRDAADYVYGTFHTDIVPVLGEAFGPKKFPYLAVFGGLGLFLVAAKIIRNG